jgi:ribosomal protein S25
LRYDLRISTVNLLLRQYEEEGIIKLLDPKLKLKIYVPNS